MDKLTSEDMQKLVEAYMAASEIFLQDRSEACRLTMLVKATEHQVRNLLMRPQPEELVLNKQTAIRPVALRRILKQESVKGACWEYTDDQDIMNTWLQSENREGFYLTYLYTAFALGQAANGEPLPPGLNEWDMK